MAADHRPVRGAALERPVEIVGAYQTDAAAVAAYGRLVREALQRIGAN